MHSWRVLITPFMSGSRFYSKYDFSEPWNSRNNLALAKAHPWLGEMFSCPAASGDTGRGGVSYMMIWGPDVLRPGGKFGPHFTDRGDHVDELIFVAEVADSGILWTEPGDLSISEMSFRINDRAKASISSHHVGGAMVLCDDGYVEFLDESVSMETVRRRLLSTP